MNTHSNRIRRLLPLLAAAVLVPAAAHAQLSRGPEGPLWESYERAAAVLMRGLEAHGGVAAIRDVGAMSFRWEGEDYAPTQGRTPQWDPAANARRTIQDARIDLARNRFLDHREFHFGGGYVNAFRQVGRGAESLFYNPYPERGMAGTVYRRDTGGVEARRNLASAGANMPILLLRSALARAATLRHVGAAAGEDAIMYTTPDGDVVTLYFGADTHLLTRRELVGAGSLGDEVNTFHYGDYHRVAGLLVPQTLEVRWNELLTGRHRLVSFATTAEVPDSVFETPPGYTVQAPAEAPAIVPIADGLAYVERLGGGYRVLVADTDDGLLVVDAPLSPEISEGAIRLIEQAFPGRPVRWLVITHHHSDHIRGIPAFAARGATILVAPGSEDYVRQMVAVRGTFARFGPPAAAPPEPRIEVLTGRRTFGRGARAVEVIDVGPTSHAAAMLAVHVPSRRLLFQGDLLRINEHGGVVHAPDAARDLDGIIRRFRLDVQHIGAVHGLNGTIEHLRAALQAADGR